jgi:DNA polymerase-1
VTEKLLIIDTHYLAYRSFYGLVGANFVSPSGQPTNAVFGFAKTFFNIFNQIKPTHLGVAYDKTKKTFRHEQYPRYKADRRPTPDDLRSQFPYIYKLLEALAIPVIGLDNYEADDIIATLSTMAKKASMTAFIVSGDRDTFQLVDSLVTVLQPQKNSSDLKYMTPEAIEQKYKVTPRQYPDLAAIVGEVSDNILGVAGVGPVGAAKLINQYGSLDNILQIAPSMTNKTGVAVSKAIDRVKLNRQINRLVDNIDLGISLKALQVQSPDVSKALSIYDELGFGRGLRDSFCQFAKSIDNSLDITVFDNLDNFSVSNKIDNSNLTKADDSLQGTLF